MAIKASDNIKYFHNAGGPTITTVARPIIEENGLYFKDIDGTGKVSAVNDWRLSPAERNRIDTSKPHLSQRIAHLDTSPDSYHGDVLFFSAR